MAKYTIDRACGHSEVVSLYGPNSKRDATLKYMAEGECSECRRIRLEAERVKANEEAAQLAKEEGLPDLKGSEKQIAWAESIRREFLEKINLDNSAFFNAARTSGAWKSVQDFLQSISDPIKQKEAKKRGTAAMIEIVAAEALKHTEAKWWIDFRDGIYARIFDGSNVGLMQTLVETYLSAASGEEFLATVQPVEPPKEPGIILEPQTVQHPFTAIVKIMPRSVIAHYPERNQDFRAVVTLCHFRWNKDRWERETNRFTDVAAEVCRDLLAAGFRVESPDSETANAAKSGEFWPSHGRRLFTLTSGEVVFSWDRDKEDIFTAVKSVRTAKWLSDHHCMRIDRQAAREAIDFAERNGFRVHPSVIKVADKWDEEALAQEVVDITVEREKGIDTKPVPLAVPTDVQVHPELVDA